MFVFLSFPLQGARSEILMFVKRRKGKIFSNKLVSSEVLAKPSKTVSGVMRCNAYCILPLLWGQALSHSNWPRDCQKEAFPVWLISTICTVYMKSDRYESPILRACSSFQVCNNCVVKQEWKLSCDYRNLLAQGHTEHPNVGHPAHSALLNTSGHLPCKRSHTACVKYCIYIASIWHLCF